MRLYLLNIKSFYEALAKTGLTGNFRANKKKPVKPICLNIPVRKYPLKDKMKTLG